jgi:predicted chitinase
MSVIQPTNSTGLIIDDFINYANAHLSTISGIINTISLYPPLQTPGPAVIMWTGYTVTPATPSQITIEPPIEPQTQEEKLEQAQTQVELLSGDLNEANEILAEGKLPPENTNDVNEYIALTEEKIDNIDLNIIANQELRAEQDKKPKQRKPITGKDKIKNLDLIEKALIKIGITDTAIIKAVKANALKESEASPIDEDMRYGTTSNSRIKAIFGARANKYSDAELTKIKESETSMGDLMYGPESGQVGKWLGNTAIGDGFKYRGRGFIQLTGKANYSACSLALYKDTRLVTSPDSLLTAEVAADSCAWFVNRSLKSFSKKMSIAITNPSQEDANLLITSIIAGSPIKRGGSGFLASLVVKVDGYSTQV